MCTAINTYHSLLSINFSGEGLAVTGYTLPWKIQNRIAPSAAVIWLASAPFSRSKCAILLRPWIVALNSAVRWESSLASTSIPLSSNNCTTCPPMSSSVMYRKSSGAKDL